MSFWWASLGGAPAPRDPLPGQAVRLDLTLGPTYPQNLAWVYWTNDGSDPIGANGTAERGHATPLQVVGSDWETSQWGYVRRFDFTYTTP